MAHYRMYKDTQNKWRWRYVASNREIIAVSSESYHNKSDCRHSIELVKNSKNDPVYDS